MSRDPSAGERSGAPGGHAPDPAPVHRCGTVAIVGRTNVGKSTLVNRLVGEKVAIVSPVPQTTRRRILGVRTLPEGQIVYFDTPGFHKPQHRLNRDMVEEARLTLREADLVVCVADAAEGIGPGDRFLFAQLRETPVPLFLVLNKIDQVSRSALLPLIDAARRQAEFAEIVPLSALKGTQCELLERLILQRLPEHPALYPADFLTDQPERLLAGEMIREQVLLRTRQEIPHATAVVVRSYREQPGGSLRIDADIFVERESQKAIVVGSGGQMLKEIGSAARREIGEWLERPVSVFLWVKVQPGWREDAEALERFRRESSGGA